MLNSLFIKNMVLMDNAHIEFSDGLNVLSGETGSGKSVIIDCLNFVLGAKADKSMIRTGEEEAIVKAEFDISNLKSVKEQLKELEIEDDDLLIISRRLSVNGKNDIKVNGNSVTAGMLKKITQNLVDVHGQSEHFYLLNEINQLELIDSLTPDILSIKKEIKEKVSDYKRVLSELQELGGNEGQRATRLDILSFQINEIEESEIFEGEEAELNEIKNKLKYQEKITSSLAESISLFDEDAGIIDKINSASRNLAYISNLSSEYSDLSSRIENAKYELEDINSVLSSLYEGMDISDRNIDEIENRLDKIKLLKKKYGKDYKEIIGFLQKAKEEKEKLLNYDALAEKLLVEKSAYETEILKLYNTLSAARKSTAKVFSNNVIFELRELAMPNAEFEIRFNEVSDLNNINYTSYNGYDNLEFLFSANLGEPVKPLSKIISGGEISRFMLAIKTQTSKIQDISTFIFDEIDAGISGKTAKIVAQKFAKIAKDRQILAISHLPQISAMSDRSFLIEKNSFKNKTVTTVKQLDESDKVKEIIRLIGGNESSKNAYEVATELIFEADNYKSSI